MNAEIHKTHAPIPPQPHPAFTVEIDVSHSAQFVEAPAGAQGTDEEPVAVQKATGRTYQKKIVKGETTSTIHFAAGGIDQIIAERQAAIDTGAHIDVLGFNALVAQHIAQDAMRDHALRHHWLRIRCPTLPKLERFLNAYFELEPNS